MIFNGFRAAAIAALVLGTIGLPAAHAGPLPATIHGTLAADDTVRLFPIQLVQRSDLSISTDSYGGGHNLDGTTTPAGGFVPIISLFSPTGLFIADDGGDLFPPGAVDPVTGVADDAALIARGLAKGTYTLAVTEFFNFPNGNLSDGFFAAGQGNFTGPTCSRPGASFLQVNLVTCPQRTDAFVVNVRAIPTPEPGTLGLLAAGLIGLCMARGFSRRGAGGTRPD